MKVKLSVPSVHLNGTSKDALIQQLVDAAHAIRAAQEKLCQAAPNGRDYYVQEPGAYEKAATEHQTRLERLQSVYDEVAEIVNQIETQGREPTWKNQLLMARQQSSKELERHASVSINNRHRCQECYCCAALTVLEERQSQDEQAKLWLDNRKGIE